MTERIKMTSVRKNETGLNMFAACTYRETIGVYTQ